MSSESRRTVLLASCATFQEGYVNPSQREPSYFGNDYKWLRATDLNNGFVFDTGRGLSAKGFASAGKSALLFEPGTLAISKSGTIGRVGILKDYMCGNRAVINIRVNPDCDTRFIFYTLLLNRQIIETLAEGSVQKNLYISSLGRLAIELPSLAEQIRISETIGSLDDRIALLRETNATLEAIAQALFKSWFVDFDPVHAKQQGRAPEELDEATAALFPNNFEESELGLVPKGWRVGRVTDLGDVICGKTPPTSQPENYGDDVPFITIPDMHGLLAVTSTNRSLSRLGADTQRKKYLPPGSICVSCIATPGLVVRVTTESQTNQQINSVLPSPHWGKAFPLFLLRLIGNAVRAGGSGGSVFHNLNKSGFEQLKVLLTEAPLAQRFDDIVEPLVDKIISNQKQAQTLATLRDTLLPRLISGQLRLPEAEAMLEEA